ncbi:MAG: response regulator transcription factor [Myxococcota bacterium]
MAPTMVLLVEDDENLATLLVDYLQRHGFGVRHESDGLRGAEAITRDAPDLVLLDLMLPGLDGLEVCRRVRPDFRGPILMLTARVDDVDEIVGLEAGADDYIKKPVDPRVLVARIRTALRRTQTPAGQAQRLTFEDIVIDAGRHELTIGGIDRQLTTAEFELVWTLASRAGEVVTREQLHQQLRGVPYDGIDRSIDLRVSRVRKKLGEAASAWLRSVRGTGYLWAVRR